MSLIARELQGVWEALGAGKRPPRRRAGGGSHQEPARHPGSAGALRLSRQCSGRPNGCGKSTVLFACACAYRVPGRGPREFVPSTLFPNFVNRQQPEFSDLTLRTEIEFHYLHHGERLSMLWRRGKSWGRSFLGRKGGAQPVRDVYLRTLANLTNPSEVRSILQLARKQFQTRTLSAEMLIFAHRVLSWRCRNLSVLRARSANATLDDPVNTGYSEFQMSSGERTILRIFKDISALRNGLVLIDDVDTGLHAYTQQQTMLELQRSALRNNLQIIVASHSPVILDSVPPRARIFLERDETEGQVRRAPLYRDIFQKALYGQSRDQLSVLCEDEVAEGVIRGVLDVLNVRLGLRHEDVIIGRNTGRNEFAGHVRTLGKFGKLKDFILVLDGDSRDLERTFQATAEEYGHHVQPLFLPGDAAPEQWLWDTIGQRRDDYAIRLGLTASDLERAMHDLEQVAAGAVRQRDAAKAAVGALASNLDRTVPDLARIVGQREAEANAIPELLAALTEQITAWRRL